MKSILIFDYLATGEGNTTVIRFTNDSRITDEMALEKLKSEYNEYYHVGFELHDISTVKDNKRIMSMLGVHVPVLYDFVMRDKDDFTPFIRINYDGHVNYS